MSILSRPRVFTKSPTTRYLRQLLVVFHKHIYVEKKHADPEETGLDLETKHIFLAGKVGADDAVMENST